MVILFKEKTNIHYTTTLKFAPITYNGRLWLFKIVIEFVIIINNLQLLNMF